MTDRVFTPISGSFNKKGSSSSRTGADGALAGNTTRRKSAITSFKAATAKRLGVKGAAAEDEEEDGEDAVANGRIATIETCLRERRDLSVVSLEQMARVAQFEKDVERRLKRKKLRWYIIDPQSTQMQIWDLITAVALVFTALITPLEVGFMESATSIWDGLFVVNRLVDVIFFLDIVLQFFLSHPVKTNVWENQMRFIALRYFQGWFAIDVGSLVPSIFDIIQVTATMEAVARGEFDAAGGSDKEPVAFLRVIRALRLFKLVRLLRTPTALINRLVIRIATPRGTVTVVKLLVECFFVSHLFACLLGMMPTFAGHKLDSWMATHGYCRPNGTILPNMSSTSSTSTSSTSGGGAGSEVDNDDIIRLVECSHPAYIYLQCLWWSVGMLMGAPISMSPNDGPYPPHYSMSEGPSVNEIKLRVHEQVLVICLKFIVAFHWTTVIARFVFVFNNLDQEGQEFRLGWDALNRFVSFFKIENQMAMELRQYYIERNKEMRARSRRKVLSKFSPYLAEEVVWELDKKWLVKIPCFSLIDKHVNADEMRFFVRVALAMDVAVFVPKDRPQPKRLYLISQGVALYKGQQLSVGESWGAEDVLLRDTKASSRFRAFAMTYLHVLFLDGAKLDALKDEFPRAHLLARFWTIMHAIGNFLIEHARKQRMEKALLPADVLERKINDRSVQVTKSGKVNAFGEELYDVISNYVRQGPYEVTRSALSLEVSQHQGTAAMACEMAALVGASSTAVAAAPATGGGAMAPWRGAPEAPTPGGGDGGGGGGGRGFVVRDPSRGLGEGQALPPIAENGEAAGTADGTDKAEVEEEKAPGGAGSWLIQMTSSKTTPASADAAARLTPPLNFLSA